MSSNTSRGRGRGSLRSKYVTRSNLHVIATHVPAAPILTSKKKRIPKNVKKETILVAASNKSPSKDCSVSQEIKPPAVVNKDPGSKTESLPKAETDTPKKDSVLIKTESGLPKADSVEQKKEEPQKANLTTVFSFTSDTTRKERQAYHAKSNFLMLHNLDKTAPKRKSNPPKKVFNLEIFNKTAPQNMGKPVKKEPFQSKKCDIQELKIKPGKTKKNALPDDDKIKPTQTKFPPYSKADKAEKKQLLSKYTTQQGKESPYHTGDFKGRQGDKKKAKLDTSTDFESHKRREHSFWDEGSISGEAFFLSEQEEMASRKKPHTSRDYLRTLEEELYYKNKYKSKKKDYKSKETEPYSTRDKYSWYSKDYKLKEKYREEQYAFNEYSGYPNEEGDFEEVEDFEEVDSVESKVPVHFRKCVVRYLPYRTFSYFRPKWYFLSRKRYIVNCMYATGKEGKITAGKGNDTKSAEGQIMDESLIESGMEEPEEYLDNFEMVEVIPDDDIITEDVSVHDDETINDEISVPNDLVEKDLGVNKKNDAESATLIKDIKTHSDTVKLSNVKITENQATPKKKLSPEKQNFIPVIDLCGDSPETKKKVDKNISSIPTLTKGSVKNPEVIVKNMEVHVIDLEENDALPKKSEGNSKNEKERDPSNTKRAINNISSTREFLKCNSSLAFTSDFNQGVAVIQTTLAKWNSHLIGLEYMLEIHANNVDEAVVKKYHCGLCDDDIPVEKADGQIVINHIISYDHMCNYMET